MKEKKIYFLGAHTLSGACIEPRALNELIPDWKEKGVCIYNFENNKIIKNKSKKIIYIF